jgi:hypothetical protein
MDIQSSLDPNRHGYCRFQYSGTVKGSRVVGWWVVGCPGKADDDDDWRSEEIDSEDTSAQLVSFSLLSVA